MREMLNMIRRGAGIFLEPKNGAIDTTGRILPNVRKKTPKTVMGVKFGNFKSIEK
jgi:hypothetical protein